MARSKLVGFQAFYKLSQGKEQLQPIAKELAKDFSIESGAGNITLNGHETNNISLTGASVLFDSLNSFITIQSGGGSSKTDANFSIESADITLASGETKILSLSSDSNGYLFGYSGNTLLSGNEGINDITLTAGANTGNDLTTYYNLTQFETEQFKPAFKDLTVKILKANEIIFLYLPFNDDTNITLNEGTTEITSSSLPNSAITTLSGEKVFIANQPTTQPQLNFDSGIDLTDTDFTLAFWIRCTTTSPVRTRLLNNLDMAIYTPTDQNARIYFDVPANSDTGGTAHGTSFTISNSTFTHIAIIHDHTAKTVKLYQNGTLKLTQANQSYTDNICTNIKIAPPNPAKTYLKHLFLCNYQRWTDDFTPPEGNPFE